MKKIGFVGWIPFLTAAVGNFLGGWTASLLIGRGLRVSQARKVAVSIFALLMTSAIPAAFTHRVGARDWPDFPCHARLHRLPRQRAGLPGGSLP
jgi:hypothetical protein